jgi:hypothetical protein
MSTTGMTTATRPSAAGESSTVLVGGFMCCMAHIPVSIARFIALKMRKCMCVTVRQRAMISMTWIVPVIYVSIETMRAMEPRTSANKDSARKPVGSIVPIRSAIIRCVIEISVRAYRRNADADCNLGCVSYGSFRRAAHQDKGESDKSQRFPPSQHLYTLQGLQNLPSNLKLGEQSRH